LIIALAISTLFSLNAQTLLAEFPLLYDGTDITGNNGDMTIHKAPFDNGGVYSNGIYYGSDTNGSHLQTTQINNFNFDDLAVRVDFQIGEYPEFEKPIIMLGIAWRWLSAWMEEDKIGLRVNNGTIKDVSDVVVSLNEWHTVTVSYNKIEEKAWLHFDGSLVLTLDVAELNHGENATIVNSDGGTGDTYKGYWKNLEIHNSAIISGIGSKSFDDIKLNTKGPALDISIPEGYGNTKLQIFDVSGRLLDNYKLSEGFNSFNIESAKSLKVLVFSNNNGQQSVKKVILGN
jgi:hypothetical protein